MRRSLTPAKRDNDGDDHAAQQAPFPEADEPPCELKGFPQAALPASSSDAGVRSLPPPGSELEPHSKRAKHKDIDSLKYSTMDTISTSLQCTRVETPAVNYSCMTYAIAIALGMISKTPTRKDHQFVDKLRKHAICTFAMRMHAFDKFPRDWPSPTRRIPDAWTEELGEVLVQGTPPVQRCLSPKTLLRQFINKNGNEGFWKAQLLHYSRLFDVPIACASNVPNMGMIVNIYDANGGGDVKAPPAINGPWWSVAKLRTYKEVNRKRPIILVQFEADSVGVVGHYTAYPSLFVHQQQDRHVTKRAARLALDSQLTAFGFTTPDAMQNCIINGLDGRKSALLDCLFNIMDEMEGKCVRQGKSAVQ